MNTEHDWEKLYHVGVLETDWSKIEEHIQAAESAIKREAARILLKPWRHA